MIIILLKSLNSIEIYRMTDIPYIYVCIIESVDSNVGIARTRNI